jgi:molybdopterin converting factor small subunit
MSNSLAPLRVLVLGPLRDQLGCATLTVPFPDDATQASFWKALGNKLSVEVPRHVRLARGHEFLDAAAPLLPGDELALIPPVSGG